MTSYKGHHYKNKQGRKPTVFTELQCINTNLKYQFLSTGLSSYQINKKYQWQCSSSHIFSTTLSSIKSRKYYCRKCLDIEYNVTLTRTNLRNLLHEIFTPYKFPDEYIFIDDRKMKLTCYNQEMKLVFMFHSPVDSHYIAKIHGRTKSDKKKFNSGLTNKLLKKQYCKENNITVIDINYFIGIEEIRKYLYKIIPKKIFSRYSTEFKKKKNITHNLSSIFQDIDYLSFWKKRKHIPMKLFIYEIVKLCNIDNESQNNLLTLKLLSL